MKNWIRIFVNDWNVCHSLCIQQLLHLCFVKTIIECNAEFGETVSEVAAADRIHDVVETIGVVHPVCRQFIVIFISSKLETQEVGVVLEFGPEVEWWRAVHWTSVKHNSFCTMCGPDKLLQVFRTKLVHPNEYFFGDCSDCLRKRLYADFWFYRNISNWKIVNAEKFELIQRTVRKETGDICIWIWNKINSDSLDVRQSEIGSLNVSELNLLANICQTNV